MAGSTAQVGEIALEERVRTGVDSALALTKVLTSHADCRRLPTQAMLARLAPNKGGVS